MTASDTLNLAAHFLDARVAEGRGSRPAIRTDDRIWTYRDIAALSCRFAQILEDVDVRPEERVIIALPDGAPFVGALFGILRHGAVVGDGQPRAAAGADHLLLRIHAGPRGVRPSRLPAGIRSGRDGASRPRPRLLDVDDAGLSASARADAARLPAVPVASRRRRDLAVQRRHDGPAQGRRPDQPVVRRTRPSATARACSA